MRKQQYENVIKVLNKNGMEFEKQFNEILEMIKSQNEKDVKIEGLFEELGNPFISTESKAILTRVTITQGRKQTMLILKNISKEEMDNCGNALNWVAKIKYIEKGLIFKRKTEYKYFISKVENDYILTSIKVLPRSIGEEVLDEQYLDKETIDSMVENDSLYDYHHV